MITGCCGYTAIQYPGGLRREDKCGSSSIKYRCRRGGDGATNTDAETLLQVARRAETGGMRYPGYCVPLCCGARSMEEGLIISVSMIFLDMNSQTERGCSGGLREDSHGHGPNN